MIDYFKSNPKDSYNTKTFPGLNSITDKYSKLLFDFKSHIYHTSFKIHATHMLVRTINLTIPKIEMSYEDYLNRVLESTEAVKELLGYITPSSTGRIYSNDFFSSGSHDLYFYKEGKVSEKKDWKELSIIRTLYTNHKHIDFYTPGLSSSNAPTTSINIFEVNIMELLIAYRGWVLERQLYDMSFSPEQFVGTYVMPKVWESMFDLVVMNRLFALADDEEIEETKTILPKLKTTYLSKLDKYLLEYIKHMAKAKMYIPDMFASLPFINKKPEELLSIHGLLTINNSWVFYYTRGIIINDLLNLCSSSNLKYNNKYFSGFRYKLKKVRRGGVKMPKDIPFFFYLERDLALEDLEEKNKKM